MTILDFVGYFYGLLMFSINWLCYIMSGVCSFSVWRFVGKRRENSVFRVCMVLHGDIMVWVDC